jgi:hypothetical protein
MYKERLKFLGLSRVKQSEVVLTYFRHFYNASTEKFNYIFGEWPVCVQCFYTGLKLSRNRYYKLKGMWLRSERKALRVVSKHGEKLRKSPVTNYFRGYLNDLQKVHPDTPCIAY